MKSYEEWKQEKETEKIISELDFNPGMMQAMRQGGAARPQMMRSMMSQPYRNVEAELDAILAQSIVPLKRFVSEHPELLNLISSKLHGLWMNIRTGTQMQGKAGIVSRKMDQLNQQ